jgi:Tol biopolymer transport system component
MNLNRILILAAAITIAGVLQAGTASATYPGSTNGRIAYGLNVNGNVDIYSALPDGKAVQRLTNDPSFESCPAYSPDGKWIAYCSGQSGNFEIWKMKQNGTQRQQVTHTGGRMIFPDFSPDGTKIAFSGHLPGGTNEDIFVANADGSGPVHQLTTSPGNDAYPAWSPDGSKIAFTSDRTGIEQDWVMNANGTDQTQLTFDAAVHDELPDWSPDGTKIAYQDAGRIWVMNADGSDQTQLTYGPGSDFGPALVARRDTDRLRPRLRLRQPNDLPHERRRHQPAPHHHRHRLRPRLAAPWGRPMSSLQQLPVQLTEPGRAILTHDPNKNRNPPRSELPMWELRSAIHERSKRLARGGQARSERVLLSRFRVGTPAAFGRAAEA